MALTLHTVWSATVRRKPDAIALIEAGSGRSWSRADLEAEAHHWLETLPPNTDLRGRIVVFAQPNGAPWWHLFLGLISAGAIPTPVDPGESSDALQGIATAIGASWIWHHNQLRAGNQTAPRRRRQNLALIKLTSGSTGIPQAFPFTAAQMLADGRQICTSMDIGPDDLNLAAIPFGHSYGLGNLVMPLLDQGTAILCSSSALPQALAADCRRWCPTVFPAVPTLLRLLVSSDISSEALASLRLVISAGATLPSIIAKIFHEKFQLRIHGFYGSSETGGIAFDRSGEATLRGRSVGTALDGVTLNFRQGNRFSVASPAVTRRGAFSPADRGELNSHDELVLLGRTGRTVKIGGRRLDLGEVETALRARSA